MSYFNAASVLALLTALTLIGTSCSDDEVAGTGQNDTLLPYDATKHLYGTLGNSDTGELFEVVIDPASGRVSRIPETETAFPQNLLLVGAVALTAFERNERIYLAPFDVTTLVVQDLQPFATREILLRDAQSDEVVQQPRLLRFGADESELFLLDADESIWRIDLDSGEVQHKYAGIPISDLAKVTSLFYLPASSSFLGTSNSSGLTNDFSGDQIFHYDPALSGNAAITSTTDITDGIGIGFVRHPEAPNTIYFLRTDEPYDEFELMKINVTSTETTVSSVSNTNLALESPAVYLNTIHTATNSYIIRGGSGFINPSRSHTLYSIDLDSGTLTQEVVLDSLGAMLKLAGE